MLVSDNRLKRLNNHKMEVISLFLSTIDNTINIKYGHDSEAISNECVICMTEIKENSILLPCMHMFHTECIDKWFNDHNTCCVCRYEISDTVDLIHNQQFEKEKLAFMKKLFNLFIFRRDVMSFRDISIEKEYKITTLVWEDVDLIEFHISNTEYTEINYEILEKDLLELILP
jgi:hypothetical protein